MHSLVFILAGAAAGYLSAVVHPPAHAARSAFLGAALALGAACLNPWRARTPRAAIGVMRTILTALGAAAVAAVAIDLWTLDDGLSGDFLVETPRAFPSIAATAYMVTMLMGYRARHAGAARAWNWFAVAPVAGACVYAAATKQPLAMPFSLVFGSGPFVILWLLAARLADPAWTRDRWLQRTGGGSPPADAGPPARETP